MTTGRERDLQLEIGHVLFIDIVGYSRLLINEQSEVLHELNDLVRATERVRAADAAGKLLRLPAGDGMALVFRDSPEGPAESALEIAQALKSHPAVQVRMGIHSGPVNEIVDVNERSNIAGAGINIAQRVMDCGDAGHILLSKRVADDLAQYRHWQPLLHDLGECEVKHGTVISVANLYTEELGNPKVPEKFQQIKEKPQTAVSPPSSARSKPLLITLAILICLLIGLAIAAVIFAPAATKFFSQKRAAAPTPAPSASPTVTAPAIPEKSIAVLPFENRSEDKQNAFFTDGVQDEILTNLAKIADLKVISRTSVMLYKSGNPRNLREIGQQLGVAHLLEGSVQRVANRVRVNAQLMDARTDAHLWAQTYDRNLADVFAIQSEIAKAIADQLQAKLSPSEKTAIERPPTADLVAFDLYTRAKSLLSRSVFAAREKENLLEAVELLQEAVTRDPTFMLAYCQLAAAHSQLYFINLDRTPARLAAADAAVQTALRLRPEAGEAHLALAQNLYRTFLDFDRARAELAIAQRTLPNDSMVLSLAGYIDRRQGRWEESMRNLTQAVDLDPRNVFLLQQIGYSDQLLRRYAESAAALDRALGIAGKDIDTRVQSAEIAFYWRADLRPLRTTIDAILADDPAAAPDLADSWVNLALCERDFAGINRALGALTGASYRLVNFVRVPRAFVDGLQARIRGNGVAARSAFTVARTQQEDLVRLQPDYGPPLCVLGLIDAGLGRKEEALQEGRRALELMPVAQDSISGSDMLALFAVISAWVGEKDLAFEQLARATRIPGTLSYGQSKLHPFWDPLRDDPRFEKIVASLAPKEGE